MNTLRNNLGKNSWYYWKLSNKRKRSSNWR